MKASSYRILLLVMLIVLVIWAGFKTWQMKEERQDAALTIAEAVDEITETELEEGKDVIARFGKADLDSLRNKETDNVKLPEGSVDIQWAGYEENKLAFSWLTIAQWEQLQEELERYLLKKELDSVTKVTVHADSVQTVNPFENYLYLEAECPSEVWESLLIQVSCDTYKEEMRFAFEIQYGD